MDMTEPWHCAHPPIADIASFDAVREGTLASYTHSRVGHVIDVRDDGSVMLVDVGLTYEVPYARLVYIRDPLGVLVRLTDHELEWWRANRSEEASSLALRCGRPFALDAARDLYFATAVMRHREAPR